MNQYPVLADAIDINQVEDGYIIYQHSKNKVHYLNHTAVVVLELCTGENAIEEMPAIVQALYDLGEPPETEVADCLKSLFDEKIIR